VRRSRLVLLTVIAATLCEPEARIRAQSAPPSTAEPETHTAGEAEALALLRDGLYVGARAEAERVLRASPDSIPGHYVLGRAMFDAEGSLARAMFHLGRARELYERSMSGTSGSPFHEELLFQISRLAGQMELYEYQLELLGYHDHLYDPDLVAERCWPLMKLDRMDEARQFAAIAVASPNPWQRSAGLNAMCALEGEARSRAAYHAACLGALEDARREASSRGPGATDEEVAGVAVDAYNATLAAAAALRFGDAEAYALEGVRRFEPTGADPWQLLLEIDLSQGRTDDALDAFQHMLSWNDRQPAALRDQGRAETEAAVALMMLHAGETARALERIDRALARPDRRGLTTDGAEQARGRHALLRRIIRRTLSEERAEEASWTGRGAQLARMLESIPDRIAQWPDEERVVAVLADRERLNDTLRPYMAGGITGLSPWLAGELIDVLGSAVVAVGIRDARARDHDEPRADAYYDALEAEIAASRGDAERAVELATDALGRLESAEWALVRARLAAVAAVAADGAGLDARAIELYALAIEIDPGVLRRLGLALPVAIRGDGGEASEAADLLARSPRFAARRGAFELVVSEDPRGLRACLLTAAGNEVRCAQAARRPPAPTPAPETETETEAETETETETEAELTLPQELAREVHRSFFSATIELSRVDLSSLDGRTTGGSALANERLREMMGRDAPAD
jgi:tetratricopeptide (TPR) repeat protein